MRTYFIWIFLIVYMILSPSLKEYFNSIKAIINGEGHKLLPINFKKKRYYRVHFRSDGGPIRGEIPKSKNDDFNKVYNERYSYKDVFIRITAYYIFLIIFLYLFWDVLWI